MKAQKREKNGLEFNDDNLRPLTASVVKDEISSPGFASDSTRESEHLNLSGMTGEVDVGVVQSNGCVAFGSLDDYSKISPPVTQLGSANVCAGEEYSWESIMSQINLNKTFSSPIASDSHIVSKNNNNIVEEDLGNGERLLSWFSRISTNLDALSSMTRCTEMPKLRTEHNKQDVKWRTIIEVIHNGIKNTFMGYDRVKSKSKLLAISKFYSAFATRDEMVQFEWKFTMAQRFNNEISYLNSVLNSFRQNKDGIQRRLNIVSYTEWPIVFIGNSQLPLFKTHVEMVIEHQEKFVYETCSTSKKYIRIQIDNAVAEKLFSINEPEFTRFINSIPLPGGESYLIENLTTDHVVIGQGLLGGIMDIALPVANAMTGGVVGPVANAAMGIVRPIMGGRKKEPEEASLRSLLKSTLSDFNMDKMESYKRGTVIIPQPSEATATGRGIESMETFRLDPSGAMAHVGNPFPKVTHITQFTRVPCFYNDGKFTLTTSNTVHEKVYGKIVRPRDFVNSNLSYFAPFFKLNTGCLEIDLMVFKTVFHVGSIALTFVPFVNDSTWDTAKSSLVTFVDLTETNLARFKIPFSSVTPFRLTDETQGQLGYFAIYVMNPLVSNNSVSSTIDCVLTVSADVDFHYTSNRGVVLPVRGQGEDDTLQSDGMEQPTVVEGNVEDTAQNTIVQSDVETIEQFMAETTLKEWSLNAITLKGNKVEITTNRNVPLDTFTITTSMQNTNVPIYSRSVLEILLEDPCFVNTAMFSRMAQFLPDLKVTVKGNSVRTQCGAYIVGLMYQPNTLEVTDNAYASRTTTFDIMKRGGIIIDMSKANEAVFDAKWFSIYSCLSNLEPRISILEHLYLYIGIVAPLRVGTGNYESFKVQIFVDAGDTNFYGTISDLDCSIPQLSQYGNLQEDPEFWEMSVVGQGENVPVDKGGIEMNIGEDQEDISDIMKRYTIYKTGTITTNTKIDISTNFTAPGSLQDALMKCFKNYRGGVDIMLQIEPTVSSAIVELLTPKAIQTLDTSSVKLSNAITSVPSIESYNRDEVEDPGNYVPLTLNSASTSDFSQGEQLWKIGKGVEGDYVKHSASGEGVADVDFTKVFNTYNGNVTKENTNNDKLENIISVNQTNVEIINNDFIGIKNAMDNNLKLKAYLTNANNNFNSYATGVNSLVETHNGNMVKQNSNNTEIIGMINEGEGGVIAAGGVIVGIGFGSYDNGKTIPDFMRGTPSMFLDTSINQFKKINIPWYGLSQYLEINPSTQWQTNSFNSNFCNIASLYLYTNRSIKYTIYTRASDSFQLVYSLGTPTSAQSKVRREPIQAPKWKFKVKGQMDRDQDFSDESVVQKDAGAGAYNLYNDIGQTVLEKLNELRDAKIGEEEEEIEIEEKQKSGLIHSIKKKMTPKVVKNTNDLVKSGRDSLNEVTNTIKRVSEKADHTFDQIDDIMVDTKDIVTTVKENVPKVEGIVKDVDKAVKKSNVIIDTCNELVNDVKTEILKVVEGIKKFLPSSLSFSMDEVCVAVLQILMAILNPNPMTLVLSSFSVLISFKFLKWEYVTKIVDFFKGLFKKKNIPLDGSTQELQNIKGQCDHDMCIRCQESAECNLHCEYCAAKKEKFMSDKDIAVLVALVSSGVSSALGVKAMPKGKSLGDKLFCFSSNFFRSVNQATTFFSNIITLVKRIISKFLFKNKSLKMEKMLANHAKLKQHYDEIVSLRSQINNPQLTQSIDGQKQYLRAYFQAKNYKREFMFCEDKGMTEFCKENDKFIRDFENDTVLVTSAVIREEPFLVKITGPTAVGKSFQAQIDAVEIYKKVRGFSSAMSQPTYALPNGDFMNGYIGQPIILIDEIFPTTDEQKQATRAEFLMTLKSTVPLNAPMAKIEEKNRWITSKMVVMTDNNVFYVPKCVRDRQAFMRRADLLVGQRWRAAKGKETTPTSQFDNEQWKPQKDRVSHKDFTEEELSNGSCYEYTIYTDPTDIHSYILDENKRRKWFTHEEYMEYYEKIFKEYTLKQQRDMKFRLKKMQLIADDEITVDQMVEKSSIELEKGELLSDSLEKKITAEELVNIMIEDADNVVEMATDLVLGQGDHDEEVKRNSLLKSIGARFKAGLLDDYGKGYCVECKCVFKTTLRYKCSNDIKIRCGYDQKKLKNYEYADECGKGICAECWEKTNKCIEEILKPGRICDCGAAFQDILTDPGYLVGLLHKVRKWKGQILCKLVNFYKVIPGWTIKSLKYIFSGLLAMAKVNYIANRSAQGALAGAWIGTYLYHKVNGQGDNDDIDFYNLEGICPEGTPSTRQPYYYPLMKNKNTKRYCMHKGASASQITTECDVAYRDRMWAIITPNETLGWPAQYCCKDCNYEEYRVALCERWAECNSQWETLLKYKRENGNGAWALRSIPTEFVSSEATWKPPKKSFFDWIKQHGSKILKMAIGSLALLGSLTLVFESVKCIKSLFNVTKGQGYVQNGTRAAKVKVTPPQLQALVLGNGGENTQEQCILNAIKNNVVFLRVVTGETTNVVRVQGICENIGLLTEHQALAILLRMSRGAVAEYAYAFEEGEKLMWKKFVPDFKQIPEMKKNGWNLVAVLLPKGRQFKNIVKYFLPVKHFAHYPRECDGLIVEKTKGNVTIEQVTIDCLHPGPIVAKHDEIGKVDELRMVFKSTMSGVGKCGSLLIMRDSRTPIFGFHIAGVENVRIGFQVPLCQETINKILYSLMNVKGQGETDIDFVATVDDKFKPFQSDKTSIRPSVFRAKMELQGMKSSTEPVVLSKHDPRWVGREHSPLWNGALKHMMNPMKMMDPSIVRQAIAHVSGMYLKNAKPVLNVRGHITQYEAICGIVIAGTSYSQAMKLSASAGWPWSTTSMKSKGDYIFITRNEHGEVLDCEIATEAAEEYWVQYGRRMTGVPFPTVYTDALKDERKKPGKDPRVFSIGEMIQLIQFKQAFEEFSMSFIKNFAKLRHSVGINVNGSDWTELAYRMQSKGTRVFDGDFKDFGPRIGKQFIEGAFDVIDDWYDTYGPPEDSWKNMRKAMKKEVSEALHIVNNTVYRSPGGIPSGHPATTMINSIAHQILDVAIWIDIMKVAEPTLATGEAYDENVESVVCGDDELKNITDRVSEIYNCDTISKQLEKYDFKYTDASKSGNKKYTTLDDVSFLKCSFSKHHDGMNYLAKLEYSVVEDTALWIKKCIDPEALSIQNMEQSLRLCYGHGKEVYDALKKKLNLVLTSEGKDPLVLDWYTLDAMVWGGLGKNDIWNFEFGEFQHNDLNDVYYEQGLLDDEDKTSRAKESVNTPPMFH